MYYLKPGVSLGGLKTQTLMGANIVAGVFERHGYDCVITSANDGEHAGHPVAGESADPHYTGRALDFRFNAASLIPAEERPKIYDDVKRALGENYYTQLEGEGTDIAHIHAQYMGPA